MPRHIMSVDIPSATKRDEAVTTSVTVEQAVLDEGFIFIDDGAKNRIRAEVVFGNRRVIPHPNSEPQQIPGITNVASVDVQLPGVPNELTLRAWGPNADNDHDAIAVLDMKEPGDVAQDVRLVGGEEDPTATARPARRPDQQL